jgi:hypothetical protein
MSLPKDKLYGLPPTHLTFDTAALPRRLCEVSLLKAVMLNQRRVHLFRGIMLIA